MGNDNSKTTIENQQLIMQLQQQLAQQNQMNQLRQQQNQQNHQNQQNQQNNNSRYNNPVISPAELQKGVNPYLKQQQSQMQNFQEKDSSSAIKLLEILGNKDL